MKTLLTITTPSGQTLEGFPVNTKQLDMLEINLWSYKDFVELCAENTDTSKIITLHPGDKITIEIQPD